MTAERDAWLRLTIEDPIDPDLPICDPHHHLWNRPNDRYFLDELLQDTSTGHRRWIRSRTRIRSCGMRSSA